MSQVSHIKGNPITPEPAQNLALAGGAYLDYPTTPWGKGFKSAVTVGYQKRLTHSDTAGGADGDGYAYTSSPDFIPLVQDELYNYKIIIPDDIAIKIHFYSSDSVDDLTHYTSWNTNTTYSVPAQSGDKYFRISCLNSNGTQPLWDVAALDPLYIQEHMPVYYGTSPFSEFNTLWSWIAENKNAPYFALGYTMSYELHSGTGVADFTITTTDGYILYRSKAGGTGGELLSSIPSDVSFATVSNENKTIKFEIPTHTSLYWDASQQKILSCYTGNIPHDCIELITNSYCNFKSGLWLTLYNMLEVYNTKNELRNVESSFSAQYTTLQDLSGLATYQGALKDISSNNYTAIFFTDPHKMYTTTGTVEQCGKYLANVQKAFNIANAEDVVCGGDWLNYGTAQDVAIYELGWVGGTNQRLFRNKFHFVLGNHDTNIYASAGTETSDTDIVLSYDQVARLTVNPYADNPYYFYETKHAKIIVLNSGDKTNTNADELYNQFDWLAQKLRENNKPVVVYVHAIYGSESIFSAADALMDLLALYNAHSSGTVHGTTYDFTSCTQKVKAVISGHIHTFTRETVEGIPVITGKNFANAGEFYYLAFDFTANVLKLVDNANNQLYSINLP